MATNKQMLHVHRQFLRSPKSVRLPLPVHVFCFRITDTTFGFADVTDRMKAREDLQRFADEQTLNLSFTEYRDVHAHVAAQVILWRRDGQPGGYSIHHGGKIRACNHVRNVVTGKKG